MKGKKIAKLKIRRRTMGEKVEGHKATIVRMAQEHVALRQTIKTQRDRIDDILKTHVSPAAWQAKQREFEAVLSEKKALASKLADSEVHNEFVSKTLFRCKDCPELISRRLARLIQSLDAIKKDSENSEVELFASGVLENLRDAHGWAESVRGCVNDVLNHMQRRALR